MEKSLYFQWTEKYFPQLVLSVVEQINERNASSQFPYLYRTLLSRRYSLDGRWASILANYTRVAADVVALDSELPLKSRDTLEKVTGDIPKLGLKLQLTEKQMKEIDGMIAQGLPEEQIVRAIFGDTARVIAAIYERIEDLFLSEFSTGVGISTRSNGTGVRIDVGYKQENQKGVAVVWNGNADTATPIDDFQKIFDKALEDGNTITDVYADDYALRAMYQSKQVRESFAFLSGFVGDKIPTLNFEQVARVVNTNWGWTLHRVARKIKTELNGTRASHSPWAEGRVVFACDDTVGALVWTNVAEATRPVAGVTYQTADEFILAKRFSTTDPLKEITASEAMVIPVVDGVDRIYTLDSKTAEA